MPYPWLDAYCLLKKGVTKDYKEEWEATRCQVGGRMFAMQGGDKEGKPNVTLKLPPDWGRFLREQYADIVPGYYMNKEHGSSLYLEGEVPDGVVREMVDQAYAAMFFSLPKRVQREIEEG